MDFTPVRALKFSVSSESMPVPEVKSMNEVYPFEKAPEAYDRMMSGKARFRVVIDMGA